LCPQADQWFSEGFVSGANNLGDGEREWIVMAMLWIVAVAILALAMSIDLVASAAVIAVSSMDRSWRQTA